MSILHPPGYPIFIAGVYTLAPPRLRSITRTQHLLDSACAGLVAFVASGALGLAVGSAAGALIALSPHLAYNAMVRMPDTASAWPIVAGFLGLLVAWRGGRATAGFAVASLGVGLSCWLRANAMLLPLALALLAWRSAGRRAALASVLVAGAVVGPITLRNALQYPWSRASPTTTSTYRRFHPRRRRQRRRQGVPRSFQAHSTPPPSMRACRWRRSCAPRDPSDPPRRRRAYVDGESNPLARQASESAVASPQPG